MQARVPGEISRTSAREKSAEVIVVGRTRQGLDTRLNLRERAPRGVSAANQITSRNRGHRVQDVIDELNLYARGWLNYHKLSSTYREVKDPSEWVKRRARLYYWKQWKQPRTRRRHLLALGIFPHRVHLASRSRKGYWRISQTSIVRTALNNRWLEEQGVPNLRTI